MHSCLWAETLATMVHLINSLPNKRLEMRVVEELWSGKAPSYKHLRVFGCKAFCHIPKENWDKLQPKTKEVSFLRLWRVRRDGFQIVGSRGQKDSSQP